MTVEQKFFVGVQSVDMDKRITNHAILEMFSNMSMLHSFKAGQTKDTGLSAVSWVVICWKMKVHKRAKLFSTVRAVTWIQKAAGYRAFRKYAAYDESGGTIAEAEAEWVAIDTSKGTFIRLKPEFMENFQIEPEKAGAEFTGYNAAELLKEMKEPELTKEADVYGCFFDYNGHVHNSEYLNFADLILPEMVNRQNIDQVELQFKLEIKADEPKVLLEYALKENRHIITVRSLQNHDFHAGIVLTESSKAG